MFEDPEYQYIYAIIIAFMSTLILTNLLIIYNIKKLAKIAIISTSSIISKDSHSAFCDIASDYGIEIDV